MRESRAGSTLDGAVHNTACGFPMDDIGPWLTALGLEQYIDTFRKQELDLQSITLLSDRDLEAIGVALGPRKKILTAIKLLPQFGFSGPEHSDIPGAERRYLTVLFCDMVASTEYADHLDPEDFRRLLEGFLHACSEVLKRHKGLVASYIGDAVSAYFGYPIASEDDAERALLAGFEILETVAAIAEAQGQPLQVRIGVASGQVVVGNFLGAPAGVSTFAFGHVAHLAARLQTLAEPNTIFADGATYQAASGAIEFVDSGKHDLKGFSEPAQVWRARQARSVPSRFARRRRLTKLWGRDLEVRRLMRSWEEISVRRQGQVVWISGEAGIGKSRLLHEVQQRLQTSPQMLLQCYPAFENSTLYPFLTELRRHAGIEDADTAEDKLLKLRTALSINKTPIDTVLPILANLLSIPGAGPEAVSDIGSEHHRAITKQFFIDWVSHLAHASPLLLVFEDEQWADQTSRQLLNALIQNLAFIPALILVSVRTEHEVALNPAARRR